MVRFNGRRLRRGISRRLAQRRREKRIFKRQFKQTLRAERGKRTIEREASIRQRARMKAIARSQPFSIRAGRGIMRAESIAGQGFRAAKVGIKEGQKLISPQRKGRRKRRREEDPFAFEI